MLKEKESLSKNIDLSFLNEENNGQKAKLKKAKTFVKKAEICIYHDFKFIDEKTKIYWCKKENNRCNLGCCLQYLKN